jgi:hypothetical protein
MVAVKCVMVTREAGEEYDVRLGDGPARAFPFVADLEVVEAEDFNHMSRHAGVVPGPAVGPKKSRKIVGNWYGVWRRWTLEF